MLALYTQVSYLKFNRKQKLPYLRTDTVASPLYHANFRCPLFSPSSSIFKLEKKDVLLSRLVHISSLPCEEHINLLLNLHSYFAGQAGLEMSFKMFNRSTKIWWLGSKQMDDVKVENLRITRSFIFCAMQFFLPSFNSSSSCAGCRPAVYGSSSGKKKKHSRHLSGILYIALQFLLHEFVVKMCRLSVDIAGAQSGSVFTELSNGNKVMVRCDLDGSLKYV